MSNTASALAIMSLSLKANETSAELSFDFWKTLLKNMERLPSFIVEHIMEYNVQHRIKMRDTLSILHLIAYTPYYQRENMFHNILSTNMVVGIVQEQKTEINGLFNQINRCMCCFEYKSSEMLFKTIRSELWNEEGEPIHTPENTFCKNCYDTIRSSHDIVSRLTTLTTEAAQERAYYRLRGLLDDDEEDDDNYTDQEDDESSDMSDNYSGASEWYEQNEREAEYQEGLLRLSSAQWIEYNE